MDRWTAGLLLGQHCCVHFRCTGLASLGTGRTTGSGLLQPLTAPFLGDCLRDCGDTDVLQPSLLWPLLDYWLTWWDHVTEQHWEPNWFWHPTCLLLPGSLWKHWKLSWTAINRLEFTAEDLLDTASSLSINSNWPTKMFSLTALGRASTLMRHCPSGRRTSLLHRLRLNKLTQLARSTWRSLVFQPALMR